MKWLAAALLLAGCASAPVGDAERGRVLFALPMASPRGELPACVRCHAVEEGRPSPMGLGTNFYDIGARAVREVPGQTAEEYLRTSIVDPDAHLAGGYQDGLMYRDYAALLTPGQIEDLVAYMATLRPE
jgi:cytochrome c553